MRETLFIQLDPQRRGQARWLGVDAAGNAGPIASGTLGNAVTPDERRRIVVIVPGEQVLLHQANIPGRNASQLQRAIPFALEEQLADELDELHFATGKRLPNGNVPVAVVKHADFGDWLDVLRDAGIDTPIIVPDILCLPKPADDAAVVLLEPGLGDEDRAVVRLGEHAGFATEPDLLPVLIDSESNVAAHNCEGIDASVAALLPDNAVDEHDLSHALPLLAEGFEAGTLNLLQGDYAKQNRAVERLRPWRLAAVLACVAIVLELIFRGISYYELDQRRDALDQQIEALFKQTFPDTQRIVNPRVQMEQQLNALRGGSSAGGAQFLSVLDDTAEVLGKVENLTLSSFSFRGNTLDLQLTSSSVAAADQLKAQFADTPGLVAELKSVNAQGDQVNIRLSVQAAG